MINLAIGIAIGATFPAFFKMVWTTIKGSAAYKKVADFISGVVSK
jgi:hypothetical protein